MVFPPQPDATLPDAAVTARAQTDGLSLGQIIDIFLTGYAERPALAERAYDIRTDPLSGASQRAVRREYRSITYRILRDRVRALARAWRTDPRLALEPGGMVVVIGFASIDYAVVDLSLAYAGAVPVPLSAQLTPTALQEIVATTAPAVVAVSVAHLAAGVELALRNGCIRGLIVLDSDPAITSEQRMLEDNARRLRAAGSRVPVLTLQSVISNSQGEQGDADLPAPANPAGEDLALLMHTSGSTGQPKGACISARALMHTWRTVSGPFPKVVMILAPFHHMMGRDSMVSALNSGGTAHFTLRPDLSTVFEDIQLVRPTALVLFPRICEWIFHYAQSLSSKPAAEGSGEDRASRLASFLGDRLQSIVVASAPLAPRIRRFLEEALQVPVHEGYSSTETASGGLAMNGRLNRTNVIAYRLRDVPEAGYFSTDRPYPRGELCVRTRFGITRYFRNPEATADLFDAEGFCCTGDIVEERAPDQIALIDRRRNVIKLTQGEFVAVGRLEQIFEAGCSSVRQMHVDGDSRRSYLLAVVVPDRDALEHLNPPPHSPAAWVERIRQEVLEVADAQRLRSFEIPRDFILADEPFSQENGLLSSLGKPLRPAIRQRYLHRLEQLYDEHERLHRREREALRQPGAALGVESRLGILLRSLLGGHASGEIPTRSFRELGGDSLGAVQLSVEIQEEFGVTIEASQILGPRGTVREWTRQIQTAQAGGSQLRSPDPWPGNPWPGGGADRPSASQALAADAFRVDRFIPRDRLEAARALPASPAPARTVLLTGATGFLGGRLCLAWLERLSAMGGHLVCLVRPSSTQSARERLEARFAHHDPATARRRRELAGRHLEVVAGDISEPHFGLDAAAYARLADGVDAICHCAALVNHRLAFEHVFRPNVLGTAEIIRLAITGRRKPIDFVSSVGVGTLQGPSPEPHDPSAPQPECIRIGTGYAGGYFASKWACEQLLRSTHEETGLPIRVVRAGLILPDRRLEGEMNREDLLSRLIYSLRVTGLAPRSFATGTADGPTQGFTAHGLPVDQLAQAIVVLGEVAAEGIHRLHLGGDPGQPFPLDSLVDAMEAAGVALERIADYGEWLSRIGRQLRSLPARQRSLSVLDVLEAFREPASADPCPWGDPAVERALDAHPGVDLGGRFTAAYLHKYLDDFALLGLGDPLPGIGATPAG